MKFHWAADAVITETVPHSRTNPGWLVVRGLRIGAINYHIEGQGRAHYYRAGKAARQDAGDAAAVAGTRRAVLSQPKHRRSSPCIQ